MVQSDLYYCFKWKSAPDLYALEDLHMIEWACTSRIYIVSTGWAAQPEPKMQFEISDDDRESASSLSMRSNRSWEPVTVRGGDHHKHFAYIDAEWQTEPTRKSFWFRTTAWFLSQLWLRSLRPWSKRCTLLSGSGTVIWWACAAAATTPAALHTPMYTSWAHTRGGKCLKLRTKIPKTLISWCFYLHDVFWCLVNGAVSVK